MVGEHHFLHSAEGSDGNGLDRLPEIGIQPSARQQDSCQDSRGIAQNPERTAAVLLRFVVAYPVEKFRLGLIYLLRCRKRIGLPQMVSRLQSEEFSPVFL